MTYSVSYLPQTRRDFEAIAEWLTEYSDAEVARRRVDQIRSTCQSLTDFPYRGAPRSEVHPGLRMIPAADNNAIISYFVDEAEKQVTIVVVRFAGGDWETASRLRLEVS